jgi:hypothetical protein
VAGGAWRGVRRGAFVSRRWGLNAWLILHGRRDKHSYSCTALPLSKALFWVGLVLARVAIAARIRDELAARACECLGFAVCCRDADFGEPFALRLPG